MNNSRLVHEAVSLTLEEPLHNKETFRAREGELITIIAALRAVQDSPEWSTLKTKVFDDLPLALTREIQSEARKENPDTLKLNRLAGQLKWAEKYSDLSKLEQVFKLELTNVRTLLYGKTQEKPGREWISPRD